MIFLVYFSELAIPPAKCNYRHGAVAGRGGGGVRGGGGELSCHRESFSTTHQNQVSRFLKIERFLNGSASASAVISHLEV